MRNASYPIDQERKCRRHILSLVSGLNGFANVGQYQSDALPKITSYFSFEAGWVTIVHYYLHLLWLSHLSKSFANNSPETGQRFRRSTVCAHTREILCTTSWGLKAKACTSSTQSQPQPQQLNFTPHVLQSHLHCPEERCPRGSLQPWPIWRPVDFAVRAVARQDPV